MILEQRKTKKSGISAEENQEMRNKCWGEPRKAGLERRKTKKSWDRAEENQEKRGKSGGNQENRG